MRERTAISVVNTLPGLLSARAGHRRLGNGNGGVSGPGLLPVGVLAVARVVERTGGMPVIGVGGVRSADDVRQYLRVGAALVGDRHRGAGRSAAAGADRRETWSGEMAEVILALDLPAGSGGAAPARPAARQARG